MNSIKGKIAVALSLTLLFSSLIGCTTATPSDAKPNQTQSKAPKKDIKLTWYIRGTDYDKIESLQELQKRVGIQIEWQAVDNSNADEQYKLMIAAGNYPDIIQWIQSSYPGGVPKLVSEGVLIKLNNLIEKNTPNFKKILDSEPEIKKQILMDDGTIAVFPCINPMKSEDDLRRQATTGFVMRKDWLDRVNLNVPTTIDDWYTALKAFKDKDPNGDGIANEIPYDGTGITMFEPAWGIRNTYYLNPKTNKVSYGPLEPTFKEFLAVMNRWYSEGLLGRNSITNDTKATDININDGIVGSFKGLDNAWTKYLPTIQKKSPNASFAAVPWPKGPAGKPYTERTELVTYINRETTSITSACKYPEEAARLIDYFYSKEGDDLVNWGFEGKSYKVVNGKKQFLEEVLKPANVNEGVGKYAKAWVAFPKYGGSEAQLGRYTPEQIAAEDQWRKVDTGLLLPAAMSFTDEENKKLTEINSDVGTYSTDMFNKFVTGAEPLSDFDAYVQTMKKMKIEEALNIYQAALDRYRAKK